MDYFGLILAAVASTPAIALMWEVRHAPLLPRLLLMALCACPIALLVTELRFCLPISWRRNAKWDELLCRLGSHRCIRVCRSGCCWVCLRCEPNDPNVKRFLERVG